MRTSRGMNEGSGAMARLLIVGGFCWAVNVSIAAAPALPAGLGGDPSQAATQPSLPSGLRPAGSNAAPELPTGLGNVGPDDTTGTTDSREQAPLARRLHDWGAPVNLTGFAEVRAGSRVVKDPWQDDVSIAELRLQLKMSRTVGPALFNLTTDILADHENDNRDIDLEEGQGWLDLRAASVSFTPFPFMDIKAGRQILTWGTGDLIFINDLFPKDWNSFFIGRDDEYLKAPSDAIKVSLFARHLPNLDIVYTPRFDADRYVDGRRLSFFNPLLQRRSGEDSPIRADMPDEWLNHDEIAARLYKNLHGWEAAAYFYHGYWKSPAGMNPATGRFTFPELTVYGASLRGALGPGIAYVEAGYYDSRQDRGGDNPLVANSELRLLCGYEKELATDLTGTFQYYLQYMLDHDQYRQNLPPGTSAAEEANHTLTMRLQQQRLQQNLTISCFVRYSLTDQDCYLRPKLHYKVTDNWAAELGGNFFFGQKSDTFLNQFGANDNIYAALRYSF